uniref:ATP synthase F0 subunit 8 n=1 Tax=Cyclina sinensis TaxID=120566 RepID=A0A125S9U6_CYCSN|nr:ATP synthase F0 subunit 8 [Cyclina sinensis]
MPQFAPMYSLLIFLYVWFFFLFVFSVLWWVSKRSYSLK